MPPHILLVTLPTLLIIFLLFQNPDFIRLQSNLNSFWFIYPQTFRILIEFILWLLYHYRVLPKQMTFEGFNFDILVGISAPAVAYYCFTKKTWSVKVALVWNIIGVLLLLNIICIAMLSAPYPFRYFMNEPVNRIAFSFPFVWLPSFVEPFAVLLHILSILQILLITIHRATTLTTMCLLFLLQAAINYRTRSLLQQTMWALSAVPVLPAITGQTAGATGTH